MAVTQSSAKRKGANASKTKPKQVKTAKKSRQATKHKAKNPLSTNNNEAVAKAIAEQVAKAVSQKVAKAIGNAKESSNNNNQSLADEIAKAVAEQTAKEVAKQVKAADKRKNRRNGKLAAAKKKKKQSSNKNNKKSPELKDRNPNLIAITTSALNSAKQELSRISDELARTRKLKVQQDAEKRRQKLEADRVIAEIEARKRQKSLHGSIFVKPLTNENITNAPINITATAAATTPVETVAIDDSKSDDNERPQVPRRQVVSVVLKELAKAVLKAREDSGGKENGVTMEIVDIVKDDFPWLKASSLRKAALRLKFEESKQQQPQQTGEGTTNTVVDKEQTTNKSNRVAHVDNNDTKPAAKKQKLTNTSSTNNNANISNASTSNSQLYNVALPGTSPQPPFVSGARESGEKVTVKSIVKPAIQSLKKEVKAMTKVLAKKGKLREQKEAAQKKRKVEAALLRAAVLADIQAKKAQLSPHSSNNDHQGVTDNATADDCNNNNNNVIEVLEDGDQAEETDDDDEDGGGGKPPALAVVNAQAQQDITQDVGIPVFTTTETSPVVTTNAAAIAINQLCQDLPHRTIMSKVYRELAKVTLQAKQASKGKGYGVAIEVANLAKAEFPWVKPNSIRKKIYRLMSSETQESETQQAEEEYETEDADDEHDETQVDSKREITEEEKAIIKTKRKAVYSEVTDKLLALRKQHSDRRHLPAGHFSKAIEEACIKHNLDESFIRRNSILRRVGRFQLPPDVVNNAHITLRSLAHTSPDYVKKIKKFLDPFKARSKRTEILSHQFWRIYAESEDDAFSKFETCPNPSFLVKPMKELIEYQALFDAAKTWKSTSDGRPRMIHLLRKQLQFVIKKSQEWDAVNWQDQFGDSNDRETNVELDWSCLSPKEWSTIISSLLLLSYQEKFCEDFSQEKAELECQLRTFRLHSFEMKKVETYWCVTCGRSCSCMNVCMDCGTTVTQQKDGESIFRDAFDALLKSSIDNTSSSRDRIKQPLLLSDGSHWGHIGWLYCEAMRKYDEKYQW